ncbi:GntR family transcriptional regulator [Actinocorallia sp. A-T 12471]|uniref:GntR family transcriptional regulator n=1 Tax=Actinocorallia sp. A-T 12471 TaxID=3089813 RepID=UPI0029CF47C3|nr:GntR family transcriptional regulator [Actinocorallia sp. A-T 12471]MDX6739135.1 GntR family transcriptional regulator [Actinocorallia sp. A-T 12471]
MSAVQGKETRAEGVYRALRARLLRGELAPGARLRPGELAAEYAVSLSVVREAVTRLAGQGLVDASPQRGFAVPALSVAELRDLTRARVLVETAAFGESIARGDVAWESRVLAAHHTLARTPPLTAEGHLSEAFEEAHQTFHLALLDGSGSRHLTAAALSLRDRADLYRHWSMRLAPDPSRDIAAEHRDLADLAVARAADPAKALLAAHIERTAEALAAHVCAVT